FLFPRYQYLFLMRLALNDTDLIRKRYWYLGRLGCAMEYGRSYLCFLRDINSLEKRLNLCS
ncbi:hypothetical protein, partial [Bacteriovorax sp. DB6_IX]|uniref:hypothetical protein n=1 Tax=Bacteriovorax sp. DB6_IX TaxID=1353530 RepID=UPI001E3BF053